jgi:hypothetical protein
MPEHASAAASWNTFVGKCLVKETSALEAVFWGTALRRVEGLENRVKHVTIPEEVISGMYYAVSAAITYINASDPTNSDQSKHILDRIKNFHTWLVKSYHE